MARLENLFKIKNEEIFFKIKLQIISLLQEFEVSKEEISGYFDLFFEITSEDFQKIDNSSLVSFIYRYIENLKTYDMNDATHDIHHTIKLLERLRAEHHPRRHRRRR